MANPNKRKYKISKKGEVWSTDEGKIISCTFRWFNPNDVGDQLRIANLKTLGYSVFEMPSRKYKEA